jgi:hypothetical protein
MILESHRFMIAAKNLKEINALSFLFIGGLNFKNKNTCH